MEYERERANGFISNIKNGLRKRIALYYAAWKTGETIIIMDNATDVYGNRLYDYFALYVPGAGDLSEFWNIVERAEKFLRIR